MWQIVNFILYFGIIFVGYDHYKQGKEIKRLKKANKILIAQIYGYPRGG